MASNAHHPAHAEPNYTAVFVVLTVMTVVEVALAAFHFLPKLALIVLLVGLAFAKAIVVATYFMHLKFERRTLAIIAGIPIILCIFLTVMLRIDQPFFLPF